MTLFTGLIFISGAIVLGYVILIFYQIYFVLRNSDLVADSTDVPITIVVPFRNEKHRISGILNSINNFNHIGENFEVIFVDDHSDDGTNQVVEENAKFKYSIISNNETGKKKAIETGVLAAKFDLIASLDADVIVGPDWLGSVRGFFKNSKKEFLIMPLLLEQERGFAGHFESLDVLALTGSTIAWANNNNPIMCNGANLAYRKSLFEKYRLSPEDEYLASGDDLFFMHQVKTDNRNTIGCLSGSAVIATTKAYNDFGELLNQRVRWASKALKYNDISTGLVSWIVLLTYILIGMLGVGSLVIPTLINLFLIALGLKVIVDFLFLVLLASRFKKYRSLVYYPVAVIVQFVIIPLIFVRSIWGTFEWKKRHYKR